MGGVGFGLLAAFTFAGMNFAGSLSAAISSVAVILAARSAALVVLSVATGGGVSISEARGRDYILLIVRGLCEALGVMFWVLSLRHIGPTTALVILMVAPLVATCINALKNAGPTLLYALASGAFSLVGVGLIVGVGEPSTVGIFYASASSLMLLVSLFVMQHLVISQRPSTIILITSFTSLFLFIPFACQDLEWNGVATGMSIGVLAFFGNYFLARAFRSAATPFVVYGTYYLQVPILYSFEVVAGLSEIGLFQVSGIALTIAGSFLASFVERRVNGVTCK
ncbi:hypothetical protein LX76_04479 [Cereibacter changlensis]|uniref:DMT family transporter n=1 Tax=Cereibacter changlensis TaxID=402884 RepID=A0A2W7QNI3_9RHOB|nr:hypothetical protein LX76_04479 [Cereibacter changlensis]